MHAACGVGVLSPHADNFCRTGGRPPGLQMSCVLLSGWTGMHSLPNSRESLPTACPCRAIPVVSVVYHRIACAAVLDLQVRNWQAPTKLDPVPLDFTANYEDPVDSGLTVG